MTPQELENKREQERKDRKKAQRKLALRKAAAGVVITAATQTSALDTLNQSINPKIAAIKEKAITQINNLATDLSISGLETSNPTIPDLCPPQPVLDKALTIRDNLVREIESVAKYVNTINSSLSIVANLLQGSITTVTAINLLKTAAAVGVKAAPVVPGVVTSLLADLDDIRTLITFDTQGNPKLVKLQRAVDNGTTFISTAANTLNTLIKFIQVIDTVLEKCGKKPAAINEDLNTLLELIQTTQSSNTTTTYKGFIFEIVDKYFSPTLNQKIGQAKNSQGIVLLQTEPSFTQDPQVLIEELKLIIDRDNLKAN